MSSSLWAIANPTGAMMGSTMFGGTLGSPPPVMWTKSFGEMVQKIDEKLKVSLTLVFHWLSRPWRYRLTRVSLV